MKASRGEIKISEILQMNDMKFQEEYTFKNGHISSEEIDNIRNKLYEKLKTVDTYLFQKIDDGK